MKPALILALFTLIPTLAHAQVGTSWNTASDGSIGPHAVTLNGPVNPFLRFCTFTSSDYSGAPLATLGCINHRANDHWTATFTPAIPGLLWYGQNTRGLAGSQNGLPTDYTFSAPFEILSGFSQCTISGLTLSLPPGVYSSGIIRFLEPVSNLTCTTTCTEPNKQNFTFGQLRLSFDSGYCTPAVPNSTGMPTVISASGSDFASDNFFTLEASSMPNQSTGLFLASTAQGFAAMPGGSSGNLCLGGAIGRFVGMGQIQNSTTTGRIELALDLTQHPTPNGFVAVVAGETWNYQAWHRDAVGGVVTSNFSNGLSVLFR